MYTAIDKAIRVGKATMIAIGLGVSLAIVLGFATVALAAVPGDPFRLGKINQISNATTTLRASFQGLPINRPALEVVQDKGTGGAALRVENAAAAANGKGIEIKVPPGKSPISVNPEAGKASGLSADTLDGKDEQEFLSASRIYRVRTPQPVQGQDGNGDSVLLTALDGLACDEGDVAIGGGGNAVDIEDDLNAVIPASDSIYEIEFQDNDAPSKFAGFVLCSDSSKPFK
jgi:hypothetical protein